MAHVHIIGAGLAGLAAAVAASDNHKVSVHEAAPQAGGRCRSYFDPALNMTIDNGNHLLLSGNASAQDYLRRIGAEKALTGPREAAFNFCDLNNGERWTLRPNAGRLAWWLLAPGRRVPNTRALDYLALAKLLFAGESATLRSVVGNSLLARRLWDPLFISALNTQPEEASAALAAAIVKESLMLGGNACRPLAAATTLDAAFIAPALALLERKGAQIRFGAALKRLIFSNDAVIGLDFGDQTLALQPDDRVIFAAPANIAAEIIPNVSAPNAFRSIVNAHFALPAPSDAPLLTGLVGGASEWVFAYPDRISVTISAAERFVGESREALAALIWPEAQKALNIDAPLPPYRIIKEKRATFAATPEQNRLRPDARTPWRNLILAGDWTQTGLPATIEGAIRSGFRAAQIAAS